ncbi:glycosyltransferase family 1 protein [Variovorax sp. dw_954]|uniref:glycosyltransferase family 4 protein n=1 Tax=Variovorax sp. dw_954 TaxID=2720078 RepID=UPI001BD5C618|nr:glycosyltransferase family 1 protein [Variovorax sp. dw_954]
MDAFVLRFPRTGIVNVVFNILDRLSRDPGCDLTILLQDYQFARPELAQFAQSLKSKIVEETSLDRKIYRLRRFAMDRGLTAKLPLSCQIRRAIDRCDIYHCTDWYYFPSRKAHKNVITVYDMTTRLFAQHHERTNIVKEARKARNLRDFDKVIAISESTRRDVIEYTNVKPENVVTIPLGVDATYEAPHVINRDDLLDYYRIPRERRYILSVSTIEPRKNVVGLLDAFRLLKQSSQEYDDVLLILIGPMGWGNHELTRHIKDYPYKDQIFFPGYVALADMPSFYRHASCFAYLSFYEGFGIPILEAMKSSCPVVCSNASSMPEVIGDCGELVTPSEPCEAAEALRRILDRTSYADDLRTRGLKRSLTFTWDRCVERLLEIYRA